MKNLKTLAIAGLLCAALVAPATAAVVNYRPAQPVTVTYNADLEGSDIRPIVGAYLAGTMRLTFYPSGIVQGTYLPLDGNPFQVTGGVETDGALWLDLGGTTVRGRIDRSGSIVGDSWGTTPFSNLTFKATRTS